MRLVWCVALVLAMPMASAESLPGCSFRLLEDKCHALDEPTALLPDGPGGVPALPGINEPPGGPGVPSLPELPEAPITGLPTPGVPSLPTLPSPPPSPITGLPAPGVPAIPPAPGLPPVPTIPTEPGDPDLPIVGNPRLCSNDLPLSLERLPVFEDVDPHVCPPPLF